MCNRVDMVLTKECGLDTEEGGNVCGGERVTVGREQRATGLSISTRAELLEWLLYIKGTGGQRVELLDISDVMWLFVEKIEKM